MATNLFKDYPQETTNGIDPLLDTGLNAAQSVVRYAYYKITEREAGRPDLISFNQFGSTKYWREIMSYNGITDVRDMVNGVEIKIPDRTLFMRAISQKEYSFIDREVSV